MMVGAKRGGLRSYLDTSLAAIFPGICETLVNKKDWGKTLFSPSLVVKNRFNNSISY